MKLRFFNIPRLCKALGMPTMAFQSLMDFQNQSFSHPWIQQAALINIWIRYAIKTPEQITGEYFCMYVDWLARQLDKHGRVYALEEARYAVVMSIVREVGPDGFSCPGKHSSIAEQRDDVMILHHLRFLLGDKDEAKKYIPSDCLRLLEEDREKHPVYFLPRLTTDAYEEIYQRTPQAVLDRVSKQTFRGKNAYNFSKSTALSKVNYKLPYPGQDVLHAHYYDKEWPRDLLVSSKSPPDSVWGRGSTSTTDVS